MKLKKVAAICAKQGAFYLFDEVEESGELIRQWLGDGRSAYPLSDLPVLGEENLCAMFDITEKRRKQCIITRKPMPDRLDVEDYAKGERALYDEWPTVEHNGYVVKPLSTNDDMLFIQTVYLSPLEDMADYLRLYERVDAAGQKYIVAKNGMEITAVIMPVDTIKMGFVEKLEGLTHKCRMAVEKQEEREREKAMRQVIGPLFREGADAGEAVEEGAGE